MVIDLKKEMLCEVVGEVEELLSLHYQELTRNKDRVQLNPMWEEYAALEQLGRFHVFTARENTKLIGYSAFFVNRHLHYADLTTGINDVLYLHPEKRKGSIGLRLIKFSESELKKLGVQKVCWHCKLDTDLIPILNHMGYSTEEVLMAKFIQ